MKLSSQDLDICCGHQKNITAEAPTGSQPISTPIHQTSLFSFNRFEDLANGLANEFTTPVYSRGRNPSMTSVEQKLAALEQGEACKLFASGMGAISAAISAVVSQGDHILFVNQVYGPTIQLATQLARFGVSFTCVPSGNVTEAELAIQPNTKLIWFETPGTMTFTQLDIKALVAVAKARGILTGIDNTWATPLLQKPITMGVDIVAHSLTKYIGGHSDVVAGALITRAALLKEIFFKTFLLNGAAIGPMDAYLIERGLRTLPVRLAQHEANGLTVARYLAAHAAVDCVFHPAMNPAPSVPDNQMLGYTGLFSFSLKKADYNTVATVLNALQHFRMGVSWGGFESLAISPQRPDNTQALAASGLPQGLIRLSVGLESVDTLIQDLQQALIHAQ
ncbi:aminotransferase class I/II-fold pyridoxal phosphate-dependent enzyme [Aestuariibacter sp. GS-14]|uniref:trans-sulfuration enzyme family protein n=1 Tax=Aestuariibacter sp. GS-14 TaxID=2590670 RepID=UPI00112CF707|nr:aminotransferase class I/II-fold pyridoxal phosphate-dependent enzyme [Aestuariibacter sp. GS-14]TPV57360.1 aminotransferase class I/II-fold pyridoxal phosphate-dependent enzyme [Aestuariibacter sp. GS-14]